MVREAKGYSRAKVEINKITMLPNLQSTSASMPKNYPGVMSEESLDSDTPFPPTGNGLLSGSHDKI